MVPKDILASHCAQLNIPKKSRLHLLDFILEISEVLVSANKAVSDETTGAKPGRPLKRKSNQAQEHVKGWSETNHSNTM
jgi:hypothetical protein